MRVYGAWESTATILKLVSHSQVDLWNFGKTYFARQDIKALQDGVKSQYF